MEIRRTQESDLERVMEIYAIARKFMAENGNPRQWGRRQWPPRELIQNDIKEQKSYVCVQDGLVIGVFYFDCGYQIDPCYLNIEGRWIGEEEYGVVHRIAADTAWHGVGTFCINWAYEQCRHLRIDTHMDNTVMQNLLTKLGFAKCGIVHVIEDKDDPRIAFEKTDSPVKERWVLASASPRRRELLSLLQIPFTVQVSHVPEVVTRQEPGEIVKELSRQKAEAVAGDLSSCTDTWIIGSDTIVYAGDRVLGKPADEEDARRMLALLSGRAHSVYTGVTVLHGDADGEITARSFYEETRVHVHELSPEEIDWYIATGEPFDKAGAYGIQGAFAAFVDRIEGDYQSVVGLPVSALYQQLKAMGWSRN